MTSPDQAVEEMLSETRHVLLFEPQEEAVAREVMQEVVHQLAEQIQISDPSLENLTVIDRANADDWHESMPALTVASLDDIQTGRFVLDKSQCIVSLSTEFLRRRISSAFVTATRFYAMAPIGAEERAAKVHPIHKAVILEGVA